MSAVASAPAVSARKLRANRRNAGRSTGPRTTAGKTRCSRNAVTHGLFCHELVLAGESQELFHGIRQGFIASLKPQNLVELLIVDRLVAATWKLRRLQAAEQILYSVTEDEMLDHREQAAENVATEMKDLHDVEVDSSEIVRALERDGVPPHVVLGEQFGHRWDHSFDRLARYEQRLDYQIQRCTRELRQLRKDAEKIESLPSSPFLESVETSEEPGQEAQPRATSNTQNEPTAEAAGVTNGVASSNGGTDIPDCAGIGGTGIPACVAAQSREPAAVYDATSARRDPRRQIE